MLVGRRGTKLKIKHNKSQDSLPTKKRERHATVWSHDDQLFWVVFQSLITGEACPPHLTIVAGLSHYSNKMEHFTFTSHKIYNNLRKKPLND